MPSTSPVDFISGPRIVSTRRSFAKENTGIFTATKSGRGNKPSSRPISRNFSPSATRVAAATSGTPVSFAMIGTVRLARGFASMTNSSPS